MFSFAPTPTITITFDNLENRVKKSFRGYEKDNTHMLELPLYRGDEIVSGVVDVGVPPGKKIEHLGIRIELIGHTEMLMDKANMKFMSMVKELESSDILAHTKSYPFDFSNDKSIESYSGVNVRVRYFLRVTISRSYNSCVKELEFAVHNYLPAISNLPAEAPTQGIKMEVGIEECLHIEFEFDKQKYHLKDVILGKIFFLLVRIKIKYMELAVIRREASGIGSSQYNESENIVKHELMDGAPVKGECVPIRLFLSHLDLTPTYRSINNLFSVKYYLNLVLVDEEDRRYFKQHEVVFWRKAE